MVVDPRKHPQRYGSETGRGRKSLTDAYQTLSNWDFALLLNPGKLLERGALGLNFSTQHQWFYFEIDKSLLQTIIHGVARCLVANTPLIATQLESPPFLL